MLSDIKLTVNPESFEPLVTATISVNLELVQELSTLYPINWEDDLAKLIGSNVLSDLKEWRKEHYKNGNN